MITKLLKNRWEILYPRTSASGGPEDTDPRATEEDIDEEIVYKPPNLGRLRGK